MRPTKPSVETIIGNAVEEPVPGVITITEFEETEIRDRDKGPEPPEEPPPVSEER